MFMAFPRIVFLTLYRSFRKLSQRISYNSTGNKFEEAIAKQPRSFLLFVDSRKILQ
jgi:hypothetical protein